MSNKLLIFTFVLLFIGAQARPMGSDPNDRLAELLQKFQQAVPAPFVPQDNKANIIAFVKGFLSGVGSSSAFPDLMPCISDDTTILTKLSQAFVDLRSKNPENVKKGIQLIGEVVEIVPVAAKECYATGIEIEQVVAMIETFKNPQSFIFHIGKNIIVNHVEIIHEIEAATEAYKMQNYNSLGFWVGKAMVSVIVGQKAPALKDTKTDLLHFAEGFLEGIGSASIFNDLKACITDDEDIEKDLQQGIALIETKNPDKVKQGVQLLGQAAQMVPNAAKVCKLAEQDIEKLEQLAKYFTNPKTFIYYVGKSLLINHVEVINEVTHAIDDYQAKNFTGLGYWVGLAMDTIFLNGQVKDTKTDLLNFAKGFLEGIGSASIFDDLKACITDDESIEQDVQKGIALIETKNADKVKQGIQLLGQAAQMVPNAAKACKLAEQDIEKLEQLAKYFTNPETFIYYVGKSLLINHVEVINEVTNAVNSYDAKNFTGLGYWVGLAMDTIFLNGKTLSHLITDTKTDVINFVEGFLQGVGSASVFNDLKECIKDDETIESEIQKGIALIKTKNPEKVKQGIELLGQAVQVVPVAAQVCQAAGADIEKLVLFVKSFTNPESFLYYVGKSLLINHVEVIAEVKNAVNAYSQHNYNRLGYWVGVAMDTIILGDDHQLRPELANFLNEVSGWKAGMPEKFKGMTLEEIKNQFLGTKIIDYSEFKNLTVFDYEGLDTDIPAYFNSSQQWPGCVHPIRDQGHCGSCWAFGATEALSDRFCIASGGKTQVVLSPQYLLSCNNILNHGCNGGNPLFAWWFFASTGVLTDPCLPYQSSSGTNPVSCRSITKCADGSQLKNYYAKKGSVISLHNPASIQNEVLQNGPVEAAFMVYEDFLQYTGGIYKHTSGKLLGGHAVKIIGWGNEGGTNYWIVANSWNTTWGENGFFRIAFGECGIDKQVVVGQADLTRLGQSEIPQFW